MKVANCPNVLTLAGSILLCASAVAQQSAPIDATKKFFSNAFGSAASAVQSVTGQSANNSAATTTATSTKATPPAKGASIGITAGGAALDPNAAALNELRVDRQCTAVEEKFDVWQKANDYAGAQAQARLQVIVSSDFKQSQLSDSDRKLLRYLAYTTIWIPTSVEASVGKVYAALSKSGDDSAVGSSGRTQRRAFERLNGRLGEIRGGIAQFPGNAKLVLDPSLRDGAFARAGGLVVVSPRFVGLMDESDGVRDVVLAHELSHLYKRHSIKELQYKMITSASGFSVAKKLLGRKVPGNPSAMPDFMFYAQSGEELVTWMRESQLAYSRDQELEADACSLHWLSALNVEPREAWKNFGTVLSNAPDPAVGYASLHPSPADRMKNIELAMGKSKPVVADKAKPAAADKKTVAAKSP